VPVFLPFPVDQFVMVQEGLFQVRDQFFRSGPVKNVNNTLDIPVNIINIT
jgi:hypothetical protein